MKVNVLKYVGTFSGSEAKDVVFPRGVPVIVTDSKLYESLITQPDFVASDLAELEAHSNAETAVTPEPVVTSAELVDTSETTPADTAATGPSDL